MEKTCLKCAHINLNYTASEFAKCPSCSAIYSKVEAIMNKKNSIKIEPEGQNIHKNPQNGKSKNLTQCPDCNKSVSINAPACPNCGAPFVVVKTTNNANTSKRSIAAALAIVLGCLGIHRFYLNQPKVGIFYVIFCFTLIPAIIGFIEGIIYALMSDQDFNAKYC